MSWKPNNRKVKSSRSNTPPNQDAVRPLHASTHGTARQPVPKADAVTSELDAGKGGAESVPQNAKTTGGGAPLKNVDAPDVDGGTDRPAGTGDVSPGKNHVGLRDTEVPSVATYAKHIGEAWHRCLEEIMKVARLCAEANARLTAAEKSELMPSLPFVEATFSKLVQIGNNARLQKPEIQQLLPPHYTTMYALTLLTDEEWALAITGKVIHPDLKREELQEWRRSLPKTVGDASSPQEAATDSDVASPPIAPTQDLIESGLAPSTPSQHEIQDKPVVEDGLAANPERPDKESDQPTVEADDDQPIVPNEDADQSARPGNNEGEFERFMARWEEYLATDWAAMSKETQGRVIAALGYPERVR